MTEFSKDQIIAAARDFDTNVSKSMEVAHPPYSPEGAKELKELAEGLICALKEGKDASFYLHNMASQYPDVFGEFMEEILSSLGCGIYPDLSDEKVNAFWTALK